MAKIWAIIIQDLRIFLIQRSNLVGLMLTPAVMTVIIALVNGGYGRTAIHRLDVIDQDGTNVSGQLLASIRRANPYLTLCPMDNTAADVCGFGSVTVLTEGLALDRVANADSMALLKIPFGFAAGLAAQRPLTLTFRSTGKFGASQAARQAIQAALSQVNAAVEASRFGVSVLSKVQGRPVEDDQVRQIRSDLYKQALHMEQSDAVTIDFSLSGSNRAPTVGESLQQGLGQSVPGMGTMFVLMTLFGSMAALIVERQQWTLQRLAMMPVSRSTLLAGKILARFCLGVLQFLVVFIVGALFKMNFGEDPLALSLLIIVYTLAITAFSFAVGSGLKNPAQASGLGIVLTLTMAPLGGAWWPIAISPRFMQIIGHITPVAWAMDGFTALTYRGAHLADILVPLAVLLGTAVLFFLIAIPRFRYQVD